MPLERPETLALPSQHGQNVLHTLNLGGALGRRRWCKLSRTPTFSDQLGREGPPTTGGREPTLYGRPDFHRILQIGGAARKVLLKFTHSDADGNNIVDQHVIHGMEPLLDRRTDNAPRLLLNLARFWLSCLNAEYLQFAADIALKKTIENLILIKPKIAGAGYLMVALTISVILHHAFRAFLASSFLGRCRLGCLDC